jgi:hypothetical protein
MNDLGVPSTIIRDIWFVINLRRRTTLREGKMNTENKE